MLLVAVPFLPEVVMIVAALLGRAVGCHAGQDVECRLGPIDLGHLISVAFRPISWLTFGSSNEAAWSIAFYLVVAAWTVSCYLLIVRGWTSLRSRLSIGFVIAVTLAVLPYSAPQFTIASIVDFNKCPINLGKDAKCLVFGGNIDHSNSVLILSKLLWQQAGGAIAVMLFVAFAVGVLLMAARGRSRTAESRPEP
ncbi:MAG: hypothetical protein HZA66_00940 [Rhodopseudomonas palustris]|uniref:Uncharacterized protein n=1 Tax=Rhodopseudomonas palustris TaxID=1076 RepID=A0A933RTL6_RHOPL|nr:hypothetical protein [Rhodopseudomonas palustris]